MKSEKKSAKNMSQEVFLNGKIVIYADVREANSRINSILKKQCDLREKQLAVADYLLSKRVAVERKTTKDFLRSIMDRRLFLQLNDLKKNFSNPLLVIEGDPDDLFNSGINMHPNAIRGALASIAVDYGTPIVWTSSPMETAKFMFTPETWLRTFRRRPQ